MGLTFITGSGFARVQSCGLQGPLGLPVGEQVRAWPSSLRSRRAGSGRALPGRSARRGPGSDARAGDWPGTAASRPAGCAPPAAGAALRPTAGRKSNKSRPGRGQGPITTRQRAVMSGVLKPGHRRHPGLARPGHPPGLVGAGVTVYDPMATGNAPAAFPEFAYADSALEAANDADVVLLVTRGPSSPRSVLLPPYPLVRPLVVVDACQAIDGATWQEAGWKVLSHRQPQLGALHSGRQRGNL